MWNAQGQVKKLFVVAVMLLSVLRTSSLQATSVSGGMTPMAPFSSKVGGFALDMPGQPKYTVETVQTGLGAVEMHLFTVGYDDYAFLVTYNDYPGVPANPRAVLNEIRNGQANGINGQVVAEKDIVIGGYPGKLVQIENGKLTLFAKMVLAQQRLYQIGFVIRNDTPMPAEAKQFFDSFHML